jgi:hypothetical protein
MDANSERELLHVLREIKPGATYRDVDKLIDGLKFHDISVLTKSEIYELVADEDEFDRGRREGYDEGYQEGHDDGYEEGYDVGKSVLAVEFEEDKPINPKLY